MLKNNNREIINIKIVSYGALVFVGLPLLSNFFATSEFSLPVSISLSNVFINEFGFPYLSLIYSIHEEYNFFFFSDFFSNIFGNFLPSSWSPDIIRTNDLNTYFMTGIKGKFVPPGFLAQGYYSLSVLGVSLISFFSGRFFALLDSYFHSLIQWNKRTVYFYANFILSSMAWIRTGLPSNYFYSFTFIWFVFFLFVSFKLERKKT